MEMPDSLEFTLGRIEGKLDSIILRQKEHTDSLSAHDDRIKKLETWKAGVVAVSAATSAVIAFLVRFIH